MRCRVLHPARPVSIALRLWPRARMYEPGRMFLCGRCRAQVVLCSRCDRGNVYCGPGCAQARRRESVRAAGERYQDSRAGRFAHAARSRRYRVRCQNVTHQGSVVTAADALLPAVAALPPPLPDTVNGGTAITVPSPATAPTLRCSRCGAARASAVRLGWLRHRRRVAGPLTGAKWSASADDFP